MDDAGKAEVDNVVSLHSSQKEKKRKKDELWPEFKEN